MKKSCDNCAHSYIERESFQLRQKCRSPKYNASTFTHEMFMMLMGAPPESSEAIPVGRGGRNGAGVVLDAKRRGRSRAEFLPTRGQGYCCFWTPRNTEQVSAMKAYFIGQGTSIAAQFDTLEEMLAYHKAMPELDRHFCKLYDHHARKYAPGWAVTRSWYDKSNPWQDWN